MSDHLFVYGTLRSAVGHRMHRLLSSAADLVGPGWVRGTLVAVDWYPGLIDAE